MDDGIQAVRDAFGNVEAVGPGENSAQDRGARSENGAPRTPQSGDPDQPSPLFEAAQQTENDVGNARRFRLHFGQEVMFVPRVGWFRWTGLVWQHDPDELDVRGLAQKIGPLIVEEVPFIRLTPREEALMADHEELTSRCSTIEAIAKASRSAEQARELAGIKAQLDRIAELTKALSNRRNRRRTLARNAGNSGPIKNMLGEAQTELAVPLDDIDAQPLWINTESHVIQARKVEGDTPRGETREVAHDPGYRMTKIMPVKFDSEARCPQFHSFIERILPDPHIRAFLQRWFGVSMTAEPVQHMVFFYGAGANGKSVLVDTIAEVMGDYARQVPIESITGGNRRDGGSATPDLMQLVGARMVRTSEPEEGEKLQEGLIKQLTGGEPILARALHSDFVRFTPFFKLVMSGNHRPDIRGTDDGIWRRFLMVPFDVQIPEAERDIHLAEKLFEERDGIFQWLLEGLREYLTIGLAPPDPVTEAVREFRADQDPVGAFLTDCTEVSGIEGDQIQARELNEAFRYWQICNGAGVWGERTVATRLKEKAERWRHPKTGQAFTSVKASTMKFTGIKLTPEWRETYDNAHRTANGQLKPPSASSGHYHDETPHPDWD